jgi:hypothetical protein
MYFIVSRDEPNGKNFMTWSVKPRVDRLCPKCQNKTGNTLFCELFPVTHIFLLLTDNVQSLKEVGHVVTTTLQHLLWPRLVCLMLGNS